MPQEEVDKLLALPEVHDQVAKVTTPEIYTMGEGKYHVAVMDYGIKQNILNYLASFGCRLTVFPAFTSAQEVLASQPDGIFLSNGPGDPKDLTSVIEEVKNSSATPDFRYLPRPSADGVGKRSRYIQNEIRPPRH